MPMIINNEAKIVDLSPMDAVMTDFGVTILYIYAPTDKNRYNLELLKASFIETLDQDYCILLGELYSDPARHGMVCVKQDAATLSKVKPLNKHLSHSRTTSCHLLITAKCSLLVDGGLAIGIDIAHGVLNAEAAFTFGKVWAQHYRRLAGILAADGLEEPIKLNYDRHLLTARGNGASAPHPEFRASSPSAPSVLSNNDQETKAGLPIPVPVINGSSAAAPPSTAQRTLHLSPDKLKRLKTLASGSTDAPGFLYVSTIDSLAALLIVLITQARGHGKDIHITTSVNARAHLQPPLPTNYVGNVIFNALSTYQAAELAPSSTDNLVDTLRVVARRVREFIIRTRDDQFLRDSMEFISSQPDMSAVRVGTDFFFGPDLFFTSWVRMGAYDSDFGGGKASYAGIPRLAVGDGLIVITDPMHPNVDGLDVVVFLECEALERFSEQWQALAL